MLSNYKVFDVRLPAVLTTSYVAGTELEAKNNENQLILYVSLTKGSTTSMEFKVEFAPELRLNVAYDGQTANFTLGSVVTGTTSKARGVIVADTDGGTTGTLTLKDYTGTFIDNEAITDVAGGAAVVNGAQTDGTQYYQEGAGAVSGGTETNRELEHSIVSANQSAATQLYRFAIPITDRKIKISFKGTGTMTSSSVHAYAVLGRV